MTITIIEGEDRESLRVRPSKRLSSFSCGVWFFIGLVFAAFILSGCAENRGSSARGEYLIRVGNQAATANDFKRISMMAESVYSRSQLQDPVFRMEIRHRVLDQMIEELIVAEVADTRQVVLSEAEVDTAVSELKNDYPEGAFERIFLESAVSFDAWKSRLKIRLLAEKLARKLFEHQTVVLPDEISEYVRQHKSRLGIKNTDPGQDQRFDEIVMQILRKEKMESAYARWMKKMRNDTTVEMNQDLWARMNGSFTYYR